MLVIHPEMLFQLLLIPTFFFYLGGTYQQFFFSRKRIGRREVDTVFNMTFLLNIYGSYHSAYKLSISSVVSLVSTGHRWGNPPWRCTKGFSS